MVAQEPLHLNAVVDPTALVSCPSAEIDTKASGKDPVKVVSSGTSSNTAASDVATGSNSKSSRRVRFNETVFVRATLHVDDYTDEEYDAAWFNKQECAQIKEDYSKTVALVQTGIKLDEDDEEHCLRGLEPRTPRGYRRRRDNKYVGMCVVLDEQDRQIDQGEADDVAIREAFVAANCHCRNESYAAALKDQIDALRIYAEDDDANTERTAQLKIFIKKTMKLRRLVLEEGRRMKEDAKKARSVPSTCATASA